MDFGLSRIEGTQTIVWRAEDIQSFKKFEFNFIFYTIFKGYISFTVIIRISHIPHVV